MCHLAKSDVAEITATINALERSGEYDLYLTEDADWIAGEIGLLLSSLKLRDGDVDAIVGHTVVGPEETRLQVQGLLRCVTAQRAATQDR